MNSQAPPPRADRPPDGGRAPDSWQGQLEERVAKFILESGQDMFGRATAEPICSDSTGRPSPRDTNQNSQAPPCA